METVTSERFSEELYFIKNQMKFCALNCVIDDIKAYENLEVFEFA